jgi:hypothetical protein
LQIKRNSYTRSTNPVDEDETKVASHEMASEENKENVPLPSPRDIRIINTYFFKKLWYVIQFLKPSFKSVQSATETPRGKNTMI